MDTEKDLEMNNNDEEIVYEEEDSGPIDAVSKMKKKLDRCVSEKQEYLDGWQRAQADLVNAKKRFEGEKREFAIYATQNLIFDLLPCLDSFDMAFKDKEAWEKAPESWRKGIEYIYTQILNTLTNNGVTQIKPLGERFKESEHESISMVKVESPEDDHKVMEVIMSGYKLNNKIIRPAKVKVGTVDN